MDVLRRYFDDDIDAILASWPQIERLQRAFLREYFELGIQVGSRLRSRTGTLREVTAIRYSQEKGFEGLPLGIETRIVEGHLHGKTSYPLREVAIGARKFLFTVLNPQYIYEGRKMA